MLDEDDGDDDGGGGDGEDDDKMTRMGMSPMMMVWWFNDDKTRVGSCGTRVLFFARSLARLTPALHRVPAREGPNRMWRW